MGAFNLLIGICLLVGHDWTYTETYRVCDDCDLLEKFNV